MSMCTCSTELHRLTVLHVSNCSESGGRGSSRRRATAWHGPRLGHGTCRLLCRSGGPAAKRHHPLGRIAPNIFNSFALQTCKKMAPQPPSSHMGRIGWSWKRKRRWMSSSTRKNHSTHETTCQTHTRTVTKLRSGQPANQLLRLLPLRRQCAAVPAQAAANADRRSSTSGEGLQRP